MGAIAEGLAAYAQPLLDQTDGSLEQMNKAFEISQLCFNLALLPEAKRAKSLEEMQPTLQMDDEEFALFRDSLIIPMIQRHKQMFPRMHQKVSSVDSRGGFSVEPEPKATLPYPTPPVADRYAPCPCNSGKKYKFCCRKKGR